MNLAMNDASTLSNQYAEHITPAILEASEEAFFLQFELYQHFAKHLHIDVCDGVFVSSLTVPYTAAQTIDANFFHQLDLKNIETEVHLMVADPHNIGCDFIRAGAKRIIAQWESFQSVEELKGVIESWESRHATVGISILVPTDIEPLLSFIEQDSRIISIQVMSIDPIGMQGRSFDTRAIARIKEVRKRFPHIEISVDGSMNAQSIPTVFHAGATRAVVGSAVSKQPYPPDAYKTLCEQVVKIMR